MLIDRCTIFVRSGRGGHGCMSFRREKFVPKGGPDGGDGGDGGSVILVGDDNLTTLLPLTPRPHYRATSGGQGEGRSKHGANGDDRIVKVPIGTLVYDADSGDLLADVSANGETITVAKGGRGGFGNEHFKSATNQTPREFTEGGEWEELTLNLELKLIADVGVVGKPNAGKSTFLRAISRATPKVADYPFTTLHPHLGIATLTGDRRLIVADIPGLIEGAADGAGLGHDFLRHVERTEVLLHLIDLAPFDGTDPVENYTAIRSELEAYSDKIADKPVVVVLNKVDLLPDGERQARIAEVRAALRPLVGPAQDLPAISGATGEGVDGILERCWLVLGSEEPPGWRT